MQKLAFHGVTTFRWSLLEDVAACHDFGLKNIGLWRRKLSDFGEDRSVELVRDSGLNVSSLSWAGGFTGSNDVSFDEALEDAREAIRLAAELNAGCLVVVSGGRRGHTRKHACDLLFDALDPITDWAGKESVTLALQPMHPIFRNDWSFLTSIDAALDVIAEFREAGMKLALDAYHVAREPRLIERLPELVPHLAIVQLGDGKFPPKSKYDRRLPGNGDVPLADIVQTLVEAGYEGCFEIALWSRTLWKRDGDELIDECLSRFDAICRR